jgi:hypothetical protein
MFSRSRVAAVGTITAADNTTWTVPAVTNFANASFLFASSDLDNNGCNGNTYATSEWLRYLLALNGSDIVTTDASERLRLIFSQIIIRKCTSTAFQL